MTRRATVALILTALLWGLLGMTALADSQTPQTTAVFSDVPRTSWEYDAIAQLTSAGVVAPAADGHFRPSDPIRRSELIKMALAARGIDFGKSCLGLFSDVPCSTWYAPAAETAYRLAVADGVGSGDFAPDRPVTREELVTTIVRATGHRLDAEDIGWRQIDAVMGTFTDGGEVASWARASVAWAYNQKLVQGYSDSSFRPGKTATRAEAASMIARILVSSANGALNTVKVDGRTITFRKQFSMTASMYAVGEPGVGTVTYSGLTVHPGTVAVDPTVIPLGSLLYVEGYGYAIAADIGGAIKGQRIDLYSTSYDDAEAFGMQARRVWVLS